MAVSAARVSRLRAAGGVGRRPGAREQGQPAAEAGTAGVASDDMTLPPAPPLTEQDRVPAPRQRQSVVDMIFPWKWRRKERLIIAAVLLSISAILLLL